MVLGAIEAYKSMASAFRFEKKSTIKDQIKGEGYSKWVKKSRVMKAEGIPFELFDDYIKSWSEFVHIKKTEYFNDIKGVLSMSKFVNNQDWSINEFNFDNHDGKLNSVVCLTGTDGSAINIVTALIEGSFALSKNKIIYENYLSAAGGIYRSTNQIVKQEKRDLSENDI